MMPSRCCIQHVGKFEDPAVATGLEKVNLIPIPKKGSTKECANHQTNAFLSHASKVMLKILHARLQHYVNQEIPDVQAGIRKAEEPEFKPPHNYTHFTC